MGGVSAERWHAVYDALREVARRHLRGDGARLLLRPTELVHEAYLRLVESDPNVESELQFLALASQAMRHALVDAVRRARAQKRGLGWRRISLSDHLIQSERDELDLLALDEALEKLASRDPRCARIVELRYFGGLEVKRIAELLGVTDRTIRNDWSWARRWLRRELAVEEPEPDR
jgi:RNA polymerase sigma factor (TIGR02999 family)